MAEGPKIPQNRAAADPDLKDLLDLFKKDIFQSLNCHAIGTVQAFDSETQQVKVTINYKKTYFRPNPETKKYEPVLVNYPPIVNVPAIILSGGNGGLTVPISPGDTCFLMFNDRDIDNWIRSGQVGPVATARLHSIADAVALVGLRSLKNPIADYDMDRVKIYKGDSYVGVSDDKIKIANAMTTLLTVVNGLIDLLSTGFGSPTPSPGTPLSATTATALTTYKTTVGGLLE